MNEAMLVEQFENLTLPPDAFAHGDHLRVAWQLLRSQDEAEAFTRFASGLKRYASHHGATGKYHETITFFYLHAIAERIRQLPPNHDWADFRAAARDLLGPHRVLLGDYYSSRLLDSALARTHFVLPDRRRVSLAGGGGQLTA